MKAYVLKDSFGLENLQLADRQPPKPQAGEIVVRVKSVALNYRDLLVVAGEYNPRMPLPRVPCSDGAGEVVSVGENVTRFQVGQRVAGTFFQDWTDGPANPERPKLALGGEIDGMLCEYVALKEQGAVALPEHLSYDEAASLPCAAVTAWHALTSDEELRPGSTVLLLGTGGVSIFALQLARLFGYRTIITSSSDKKLARARELGADETINYRGEPKWGKAAAQLAGGGGVDHVVEVGGAGTLEQSLRALRVGGAISLIGVLAKGAEFNPLPLVMRSGHLKGIFVGNRAMFESMNRAIGHHELRPVIDRTFSFDEAPAAFEYLKSGQHLGKVVIQL